MMAMNIKEIEKNKKLTSIKSMWFNRYLGIRYMLALFFFCNLYWLLSLGLSKSYVVLLPLVNLFVAILAMYEQVKIYSTPNNKAKFAKLSFVSILTINFITMFIVWLPNCFKYIFPFINENINNRCIITVFLMLGIMIAIYALMKLKRINNNQDKQYFRVKKYEKLV